MQKKKHIHRTRIVATLFCMQLLLSVFDPGIAAIGMPGTGEVTTGPVLLEGDLSPQQLATKELTAAEVPEFLDLQEAKDKGHVQRLWAQEPELNTVMFQNRDGTKTMYYLGYPVKYVDTDGVVRDKSSLLTSETERTGYQYVNKANDIKTWYPTSIQSEKGVKLEHDDIAVELSPIGAVQKRYLLSDGRELTRSEYLDYRMAVDRQAVQSSNAEMTAGESPVVLERVQAASEASAQKIQVANVRNQPQDTVNYANVFGEKTALRYQSTFEGFKEDIVLFENTGVNRFSFRLKTGGLSLIQDSRGDYYLADPITGEYRAAIGELEIRDSGNFPDADSQYVHRYEAETVTDGEEYILTIVVDETYLNAEERVYPVTIDPTITLTNGDIEDATLYSDDPKYASGAATGLFVGNDTAGGFGKQRFVIKARGLVDAVGYYASAVCEAKLHLYNYSNASSTSLVNAYIFQQVWSEGTVCYSWVDWNKYTSLQDTVAVTNTPGYHSWSITDAVRYWLNESLGGPANDNQGLLFMATDEAIANKEHKFYSSNYSNASVRPYIEISFSVSGNVVEGWLDEVNNGVVRGWAWNKSMPNTPIEVHFYLYDTDGNYVIGVPGIMANQYRVDLVNAGKGNGYHGFVYDFTTLDIPNGTYMVRMYGISNGSDANPQLSGSPKITSFRRSDVSIAESSLSLEVGQSYLLTKSGGSVSWTSSDSNVAKVDYYGKVTATGTGTAIITARLSSDSTKTDSCLITVSALLIYETRDTPTKYFPDESNVETLRDDLFYNDMSTANFEDWYEKGNGLIPPEALLYSGDRKQAFLDMATGLFANDTFDPIITDMFEHFMGEKTNHFGDSINGYATYSNSALTAQVKNHVSSKEYVNHLTAILKDLLRTKSYHVMELKYYPEDRFNEDVRKKQPVVKALKDAKVPQPVFCEDADRTAGFTICLNGLQGNKVEVTQYTIESVANTYSCTIRVTYYDHFGLDKRDMQLDSYDFPFIEPGRLAGFQQWFILQHWTGLNAEVQPKPFITTISFETTISGRLS